MNTIVFVMMMYSQGSMHVTPTIEFSTLAKCELAANAIVDDYNKKTEGSIIIPKWKTRLPYCVRIEK